MDFPFGLSTNLPVPKGFEDIALPDEGSKPFGNSLLSNSDSELFLAEFGQPTEKGGENVKVSPQKPDAAKKESKEALSDPQEEKMETEMPQESEQNKSELHGYADKFKQYINIEILGVKW